jgi:signal transduction histidine kinase
MANRIIERGLRIRILTGFSLVIFLTLVIAGWSYYHISTLGTAAEHLFIENYRTISYMHQMELAVADVQIAGSQDVAADEAIVRKNLALEYANITEPGELVGTRAIDSDFRAFQNTPSNERAERVRRDCESVLRINEQAMFAHAESFRRQGDFARTSTIGITVLLVGAAIFLSVAVSRRSLAEFQELDRAKSNFVATAAHELKNPLSTIKLTSGLLADGMVGSLNSKQSELAVTIRNESDRLLTLVRELLDLAKLETGTLQLHPQATDVETLIESAILPVALRADEAGVKIDLAVMKNVPEVSVDPNKMGWAITNLLSNAIRYSPRGASITVDGRVIENEIWISVTDRGKGIAENNLSRIFEKFVQVEESAMGLGSGTGLGLAIAREIALAHGGRIWATSTLNEGSSVDERSFTGRGSTFTIALPIQHEV